MFIRNLSHTGRYFQAEGDPGPGAPDPKPPVKAPAKAPEAPVVPPVDDSLALALQAQIAELQSKLTGFGDATPQEITELRSLRAKAEQDAAAAAAAARKAEEDKLREAGDFETLKARMAEEHQREIEAVRGQSTDLNQSVAELRAQIEDMALSTAFASSPFVQDQTVVGPNKARSIYGAHFDVIDGTVVGYDAPRGAAKRVALVDGKGVFLPFEQAIQRLVESDPDRDRMLKAQQKPGPGNTPNPGVRPQSQEPKVHGVSRLALAMPALLANKR